MPRSLKQLTARAEFLCAGLRDDGFTAEEGLVVLLLAASGTLRATTAGQSEGTPMEDLLTRLAVEVSVVAGVE